MRIKITLIFVITLLFTSIFYGQNTTTSIPVGWERIYIKNVGYFDLPPTMEVQKGKYKEFVDEIKKIKGYDATQLTAQQKGLNEFGKEGFEKYARVMVETTFGSAGDFEKYNFNIAEITQTDITELNSIYKQQIQQSFLGTSLKLIEWYPLKVEKINGVSCIHISYKRQLQDKPFVLVQIYYFHNNDRMHALTLSYRLSETDYWRADFVTILKSFRMTNIR
jgi:hypothetical protein